MNILKPKTKKDKQIQLVVILIITVVVFYLLWTKVIKPRMSASQITDGSGSTSSGGSTAPACTNTTVLAKGSRCSTQVKAIQKAYNDNITAPLVPLVVDGIFGTKTEQAVTLITGQPTTTVNGFNAALLSIATTDWNYEWAGQ